MPFFRLHPLRKYCTYSEFFCSECRKIRTTKTANTDTFHAEIRFGEKTEFQRKLIINLYTFLKYKKFLGEENNVFSLCKEYLGRNPNKHTVHVVRDLIAILRHYTRLPATFNTQSTHLCIHSTYFFEYLNKHKYTEIYRNILQRRIHNPVKHLGWSFFSENSSRFSVITRRRLY